MTMYISTNLYKPQQLQEIFTLVDKVAVPVGIEIFPEWQSEDFCTVIKKYHDAFRQYPITLHGPYYGTEHSKPEGTKEFAQATAYFAKTLELSQSLHAGHIVFHHNNCPVDATHKQEMIAISTENLLKLRHSAAAFGARIVVENAGVLARKNMLFDQDEFIEMAGNIEEKILLDIGHAYANGWDIRYVMEKLADKITAYHVHNNDGHEDKHDRIFNGKFKFANFIDWYKMYTPDADIVVEYGKQCAQDIDGIAADVSYISQNIK